MPGCTNEGKTERVRIYLLDRKRSMTVDICKEHLAPILTMAANVRRHTTLAGQVKVVKNT